MTIYCWHPTVVTTGINICHIFVDLSAALSQGGSKFMLISLLYFISFFCYFASTIQFHWRTQAVLLTAGPSTETIKNLTIKRKTLCLLIAIVMQILLQRLMALPDILQSTSLHSQEQTQTCMLSIFCLSNFRTHTVINVTEIVLQLAVLQ